MAYPYKPPVQNKFITVYIANVSTTGQIYVVPGFNGKIKTIQSALNGAITGGDAVLTTKIGGTAVTGGVVTIANSGSAAGDVDVARPTAARSFSATDAIEIEHTGSTGAVAVAVTLELEPV